MVTKYPLFQPNKKADVSTAILQSSSEYTRYAQNTVTLNVYVQITRFETDHVRRVPVGNISVSERC